MTKFDYELISLSDFVSNVGEDVASVVLGRYKSVFDSDTERFIRTRAVEMEKNDISRTYLAKDKDEEIVGYVTLSIKCMQVPEDSQIDESILKRMNIDGKSGVAQSYLLGQLSRSSKAPKGFGRELMKIALLQFIAAKEKVGCRMLRLDCHDELVPYYENSGFKFIRKNEKGNLNQMITFI